jgi:hypothetical protein
VPEPLLTYRCLSCGLVAARWLSEAHGLPCRSCGGELVHTQSIDPKSFIEHLANAEPREAERVVKGLRGGEL